MPIYTYTARSAAGDLRTGEIDRPSRGEVLRHLRRHRLTPVSVRLKPKEISITLGAAVKTREVVIFTRQFATLINAGVPLLQSLTILEQQTENSRLRSVISAVSTEVQTGSTLADALRRHPSVFTELYVDMVAAGEAGGILDTILDRLASSLEKNDALARKIRGAMAYPAVVLLVAFGATAVLLWQVVPVFAAIFDEAGLVLPPATRAVLAISDFLQSHLHPLLLGIFVGTVVTRQYRRTPGGRLTIDRWLLRLPFVGELTRKASVARFTRTLGTLVASGVSILEGLEVTARTAGNRVVHDAVMAARQSIAEGATIAAPLAASGVFPPMVVQMIEVGEQTGQLDTMLARIADFYDAEVDTTVSALTSILEPVMIVVMGIVIGGMVVAMYLPMFEMMQTVG